MTVEVRRFEGSTPCQYVIGKGAPHEPAEARELITWNGCEAHVHSFEMFDATEAAHLLTTYYLTDTIPQMYELRPLDV